MTGKSEKLHQLISFLPVLVVEVLYTLNLGWLAPILKQSEEPSYDIVLTSEQRSWVASLHDPFKICGMICCVLCIDKFGRKSMLFTATSFHLIGWVLIRFTRSVTLIYVARSMVGIMFGITDVTVVICLGENISPDVRGFLTGIYVMAFFGGLVAEYVLATYLPYNTVAIVNFSVGVVQLLSLLLMKETVQYLVMKGKDEQAEYNYRWLFSQDKSEFEKLRDRVLSSTKESLKLKEFLNIPAFYKSMLIAVSITFLLYATGFWTLLAYSSIVFASSDILTPNEFTISYGLIQFVSSSGSSFLMNRFNRRTILLAALASSTIINAISATLYFVQGKITDIPNFPWLVFVTVTSFMVISAMATIPIATVLRSELFPQKVKPLGVGLSSLAGSLGIFMSSIRFLQIAETYGIFVNFLVFAGLCTLSFVFAYFFVPETRGKTLHEIEQCFNKFHLKDRA